jgi:hypothetical protein
MTTYGISRTRYKSKNRIKDVMVAKQGAKLEKLKLYVETLCGIYSRIARRLGVDRTYVSRVAKGRKTLAGNRVGFGTRVRSVHGQKVKNQGRTMLQRPLRINCREQGIAH